MSTSEEVLAALATIDNAATEQLAKCREEAEAGREEWEAIKALRVGIQRKVEEIERLHNIASQNVSRINDEYERLAKMRERAANAMALRPPASPQAPKRAVRAIKDVPRLLAQLSEAATPSSQIQQLCGVYFLMQDKEVVYVGQSVSILFRIHQHMTDGTKVFNRWCYIDVKKAQLDEVEQFYITLLRPRFNKAGMPRLLADNDPALRPEAA